MTEDADKVVACPHCRASVPLLRCIRRDDPGAGERYYQPLDMDHDVGNAHFLGQAEPDVFVVRCRRGASQG